MARNLHSFLGQVQGRISRYRNFDLDRLAQVDKVNLPRVTFAFLEEDEGDEARVKRDASGLRRVAMRRVGVFRHLPQVTLSLLTLAWV